VSADAAPALAVTGSAAFGVAVRTAAGIVSAPDEQPPRRDLAGLAAAACELAGIRLADVRELRVDLGPGSYTGLRVAVTFARFVHCSRPRACSCSPPPSRPDAARGCGRCSTAGAAACTPPCSRRRCRRR
jgi:hypothetical protein